MAKEKILDGITRAYIYNANYRALQEMGAGTKLLKAFEEYKEAPLRELKAAAAGKDKRGKREKREFRNRNKHRFKEIHKLGGTHGKRN